jgi:hypothetical protein
MKYTGVNLQSQRFQMSGVDAISFLTADGFDVRVEGTIEFNIIREKAADLTHRVGDIKAVIQKIIQKENVDAILPTMGGQTALNTAIKVAEAGVLEKYKDDIEAIIEISANRFLHNMVRRIVGTLANICITDSEPEIVKYLIRQESPNHKLITTAPPQGLFLKDVIYK